MLDTVHVEIIDKLLISKLNIALILIIELLVTQPTNP